MKVRHMILAGTACAAVSGAAMAQSPLTTGEPNNGRSSGQPGAFFDLHVGSEPLTITEWEYYASSTAGTPTEVSIFVKEGSYVGFDTDPSAWTLHDTVAGVSAGSTTPAPIDPADLELDADTTYGICFRAEAGGIRYRGATGVPPTVYETNELAFEGGIVRADPFGGTLFDPRLWSGSIHYDVGGGGGPSCYADCDESGELDFFDFICFQNAFEAGEPYADCDDSGDLDFFDFICFQNEFEAGCADFSLVELGVEAPPADMCGSTMTSFDDARPDFTVVTDVPSPLGGEITFDIPVEKRTIPGSWGTWSHGYSGPLYYTDGASSLAMEIPGSSAFYLYIEPNEQTLVEFDIRAFGPGGAEIATTDEINGLGGAKGYGYCGGVERIEVDLVSGPATFFDFAVGEFGIAD